MTAQLLNLGALNDVVVNQQPYPFFVIEQSLMMDKVARAAALRWMISSRDRRSTHSLKNLMAPNFAS
jgi:hypothetical protein